MASSNLAFMVDFAEPVACANCGGPIVLSTHIYTRRREDHQGFYCPMGHHNYWPQDNKADRLRKQLAEKERQLAYERERAATNFAAREKAERKAKRLEKRISGGACPCCNRSFVALSRHIKTKHPEFVEEARS